MMTKRKSILWAALACVLMSTTGARAQVRAQPRPASASSYAIVIGSNPGGAGQAALEYAERDARRVAALLRSIGGYAAADITLLTSPRPAAIRAAIERVARRLRADTAAGLQSTLFFYYSGHARAHALNLGAEELALDALRDTLWALPATLKVVVLDACQSGAFSKVKGIEPAGDFSHNSIDRLNATGVAVMASSSATELSQESKKLNGSYFTHHLLVALRGAGDVDGDGQVSLDEAYRYAYQQTLVATARTAVGRQHVTLETDLKGAGDVPLSFPAKADAALALEKSLRAEVLIQTRRKGSAGTVIAEVHKASGAMRIALPSGDYRILVVPSGQTLSARQCDLHLPPGRTTTLAPSACPQVSLQADASKGGHGHRAPRWSLEAAIGGGVTSGGPYLQRLDDFGYQAAFHVDLRFNLSAVYRVGRHLSVVGSVVGLDSGAYHRDDDTEDAFFDWSTYGLMAAARYRAPVFGNRYLHVYGELGAGLGIAIDELRLGDRPSPSATGLDVKLHFGPVLGASAGVLLQPWRHLGFYARGDLYMAPVMENLLGDTHPSGGPQLLVGLRGSL